MKTTSPDLADSVGGPICIMPVTRLPRPVCTIPGVRSSVGAGEALIYRHSDGYKTGNLTNTYKCTYSPPATREIPAVPHIYYQDPRICFFFAFHRWKNECCSITVLPKTPSSSIPKGRENTVIRVIENFLSRETARDLALPTTLRTGRASTPPSLS